LAVAPKGVLADDLLRKFATDALEVIDVYTQMFGDIPYKQYWSLVVFDKSTEDTSTQIHIWPCC